MRIKIFLITISFILCSDYIFADEEVLGPAVIYSGFEYADPFKSHLPKRKELIEVKDLIQAEEGELPDFKVQGIVWGGDINQAIIDGFVVKVGDTFKGVKIVEINPDRIKLSYAENIFYISVKDEYDNESADDEFE
ncbi:MAG TPA: hypothetical protein ENH41_05855 [Candidatus Omnitrophica bacterium]|nr:hypothetical protein [Candidatus Omnitrophota bacterium]